jgi:PleD family two-component response regulator
MTGGQILVVEDDFDISNMLRIYFSGQGYDVRVAGRGSEALEMCRQQSPNLIILDIMLPDMDGYAVCKELRTTTRTKHIPIIFLTQKDERSDKIAGLQLGADDYITKPFDIEELKLRVQNAIDRARRENLTDPITGLPAARLIEDELRGLMRRSGWTLVYVGIDDKDAFDENYGFVAGDEVLRYVGRQLIPEVVDEAGTPSDFVGHAGSTNFIVITETEAASRIIGRLRERFNREILTHYSFMDRERGMIEVSDGQGGTREAPIMSLSIGTVSDEDGFYSDIREIAEAAAEARRIDRARDLWQK